MVVRPVWWIWRGKGEWEGLDGAFDGQDERVLDHGSRSRVCIWVLYRFHCGVVDVNRYGSMPRLVEFDHIYRCLQSLLVYGGWEWLRIVESNQDTDIKKLVLGNPEVTKDGFLGSERECGFRGGEIDGGNELIHAGI